MLSQENKNMTAQVKYLDAQREWVKHITKKEFMTISWVDNKNDFFNNEYCITFKRIQKKSNGIFYFVWLFTLHIFLYWISISLNLSMKKKTQLLSCPLCYQIGLDWMILKLSFNSLFLLILLNLLLVTLLKFILGLDLSTLKTIYIYKRYNWNEVWTLALLFDQH